MSSCIAFVCYNMSVLNTKVCSHFSHFNLASALRGASQSLQGYLGTSWLDSMWHLKGFLLHVSHGYWITFLTRRSISMGSRAVSTQVFHTACFIITIITRILSTFILECFMWRFFVFYENPNSNWSHSWQGDSFMHSFAVSTQMLHAICFMITIITRILSTFILECFMWRFFVFYENSVKGKPGLTMLEGPMFGLPVNIEFCFSGCAVTTAVMGIKHIFLLYAQNVRVFWERNAIKTCSYIRHK